VPDDQPRSLQQSCKTRHVIHGRSSTSSVTARMHHGALLYYRQVILKVWRKIRYIWPIFLATSDQASTITIRSATKRVNGRIDSRKPASHAGRRREPRFQGRVGGATGMTTGNTKA
jgi:hypothetical protein